MAAEYNELLYGADHSEGLCGAAEQSDGLRLWWRRNGKLESEDQPYRPFFLCSNPELLDSFKPDVEIVKLSGKNHFGYKIVCDNWEHCDSAASHVGKLYRANKNDYEDEVLMRPGDSLNTYLLDSGRTHYKNLDLDELNVLYISLRALSGGGEYADPTQKDDQIALIGLSDGRGWSEIIESGEGGEGELIERFVALLTERDPDVLAGHDLYKSGLSYIFTRAKRLKIKLPLGRDGSLLTIRKSRAPAAEKQLEYPRADIAGRSVVDSWFLAVYYDIVKRDLERFDAPYVARYLERDIELAEPLMPWDIDGHWIGSRDVLRSDVENELAAVKLIFSTLVPSYYAQAQMLPYSLQDSVVRGNGVKINNLLLREYLRRNESIPEPQATVRGYVGGFTELRRSGVIPCVLNVDMASLYPSIMLQHGVKPKSDTGNVFQPLLRELTSQRLAAKKLAKTAEDKQERVRADARQAAFKIFINSFFGYLGTNRMNWADPRQAEFITTTGQKLVQELAAIIERLGGGVIEIDTDGVYFTAPDGCNTKEQYDSMVQQINSELAEGMSVELGGFYPAMLSHKVKNYALIDEAGEVMIKGSGMKSRGLEPYLHSFLGDGIRAILRGQPQVIEERYDELKQAITAREIDIRELASTDNLIESLDIYRNKTEGGSRNRAAAYEVALRAKRPLRPGDQVSYYITGEKQTVKAFEAAKPLREFDPAQPDYNVKYYLKKLDENLKKLKSYQG